MEHSKVFVHEMSQKRLGDYSAIPNAYQDLLTKDLS